MRMVSFVRFLSDLGIIMEKIFFSIIDGDNFVRGSYSVNSSKINLKYGSS